MKGANDYTQVKASRMVAIITRSAFEFLNFQKSVIVTGKKGKTMSLQKGSSARCPSMPSFVNQIHFLKPHLLGKIPMALTQLTYL